MTGPLIRSPGVVAAAAVSPAAAPIAFGTHPPGRLPGAAAYRTPAARPVGLLVGLAMPVVLGATFALLDVRPAPPVPLSIAARFIEVERIAPVATPAPATPVTPPEPVRREPPKPPRPVAKTKPPAPVPARPSPVPAAPPLVAAPSQPMPTPVAPAPPEPVAASAPASIAQPSAPESAPAPAASAAAPAPAAPAAAPAPAAPLTLSVAELEVLNQPPPVYPPISQRLGEEGRVVVRLLVNTAGAVDRVELRTSSGVTRLDQAALAAARQWRFVPPRRAGEPVNAWVVVPINFSLRS